MYRGIWEKNNSIESGLEDGLDDKHTWTPVKSKSGEGRWLVEISDKDNLSCQDPHLPFMSLSEAPL